MTSILSSSRASIGTHSQNKNSAPDDLHVLTSHNPFPDNEDDQSSYALVTSLFSRVRNSLGGVGAPLVGAQSNAAGPVVASPPSAPPSLPVASPPPATPVVQSPQPSQTEFRRPPHVSYASHVSTRSDRPNALHFLVSTKPAQPLLSRTPVVSEAPSLNANADGDRPSSRAGSLYEHQEGTPYGSAIPGFPIPDDARSIRTTKSIRRSDSVSKVIRRIRGEGISKEYWMDDDSCKECYDCKSVFTTWRRKHHCRICGLIYCSRCASNIVKGSRFGQEGMLRVCNLCMDQIQLVDEDDDDDDRHSIASGVTSSFPAHQFGSDVSIGYGPAGRQQAPASPYAASHLFGRGDEPFSLFSIAEARRALSYGSDDSHADSRPDTPAEDSVGVPVRPAPFRRRLADDDKVGVHVVEPDQPPPGGAAARGTGRSRSPVEFPKTITVKTDGLSSIQFPGSSPEQPFAADGPFTGMRSRYNSLAEVDGPTPFIRSRVQSRLMDSLMGDAGWRTRRESTAYAMELNFISMSHLRTMLKQMLTSENIPNVDEWEETLLKLALRIAKEMTFTAFPNRQGEDMDVRRYVKIKKIPGGAPKDSEYVDGAVITKNVAYKQMARSIRNPRIMLVTFPLEYHRVEGQYMPFSQIVRQEKEYLGNLCARIAATRPHLILAEKSVAGVALDLLVKSGIAVARSVKPAAVQLVARVTQADIVSSMDRLLEPRFGHCQKVRIQTFDHPLIPGRRKTYMRFEGCSASMGCTILLRGGDADTLRRVKKVTRLLSFIVRNLKLETHLWKDSIISVPHLPAGAAPQAYVETLVDREAYAGTRAHTDSTGSHSRQASSQSTASRIGWGHESEVPDEEAEQGKLARRIQASLDPYLRTFISASATLRFPPPQPIRRMKELDDLLYKDKQAWEDEIIAREETHSGHTQEPTVTAGDSSTSTAVPSAFTTAMPTPTAHPPVVSPREEDDIKAMIDSLAVPDIVKTPSPDAQSSHSNDEDNYFDRPVSSSPSVTPLEPAAPIQLKTVEDVALESKLNHTRWLHAEQRRVWEWYLRKNRDDFVVEKYQRITIWEGRIPIAEYGAHPMCQPPVMKYITFYGDNDCTLGKYVEKSVHDIIVQFLDPKAVCPSAGCAQPMARHCTVYIHNETRLFVAVEQWNGQIQSGGFLPPSDMITTWSICRVCGSATPFIPVSEEMQRYSFAKFLELHFYPADVELVQGAGCHHNIYQHHVRYFAFRGMTVRFQADPVVIHEVLYPPRRIHVRRETLLTLKNTDYERLMSKHMAWCSELVDELQFISIDATTGDEENDGRLNAHINMLISKATRERDEFIRKLNRVYSETSPYDTLALNEVRAYRQDKLVAWQEEFDKLPRIRTGTGVERGSRRTSAFGTMRGMWPRRSDFFGLDYQGTSSSVSDAEDNGLPSRKLMTASMSSVESASESESEKTSPIPAKAPALEDTKVDEATEASTEVEPAESVEDAQATGDSDADSDSTIGAAPPPVPSEPAAPSTVDDVKPGESSRRGPPPSRLPRRVNQYGSVAELVKRYQDYLPPQGVQELTRTALAPHYPPSESEQEYVPKPGPRSILRNRGRVMSTLAKKPSTSDFEHSYAANVAPRYLTQRARPHHLQPRLAGSLALESAQPSRRVSPEKQASSEARDGDSTIKAARASSPPASGSKSALTTLKLGKGKAPARPGVGKDKSQPPPRQPNNAPSGRTTLRRSSFAPGGKVGGLAKQFEKISKETERAQRRYSVIRGRRARPVTTARARVQVLESLKDAIRDDDESSSDSSEADDEGGEGEEEEGADPAETPVKEVPETIATALEPVAEGDSPAVPDAEAVASTSASGDAQGSQADEEPAVPAQPLPEQTSFVPPSPLMAAFPGLRQPPPPDLDLSGHFERHSILRALSGFWGQQPLYRGRSELDGDDPMADPEHIIRDSSMVVRTDEPTSIIALALNSPQYREMLTRSRAEKRGTREPKLTETGEAFMPDDRSVADSTSTWGVVNMADVVETSNPTDDMRVPSSKLPWAISFDSGGLTISCTILFPEQFDALRRTYDCDKSMVESLARCIKWDANGGKSGSGFLKTRDERFIAKDLSKSEMQTMATFAPGYFDYMSSAVTHNRPTLLAKIFGCFRITFKKTSDGGNAKSRTTTMNLLVMENLFYERRFSRIYDLKGSTRNRHVKSTGRENEVLLDENLLETSQLSPVYMREHSKRILRGALYNDSKFLADVNVMDYSLVVGVDNKNNELVVGIVDYQRTYTWDKKLESWVKDTGLLGAGKGEPTIITPRQYRQRFLSAMERYFPMVPDRWMKQRDVPEDDSNGVDGWAE